MKLVDVALVFTLLGQITELCFSRNNYFPFEVSSQILEYHCIGSWILCYVGNVLLDLVFFGRVYSVPTFIILVEVGDVLSWAVTAVPIPDSTTPGSWRTNGSCSSSFPFVL